jgi:hypothetical protein
MPVRRLLAIAAVLALLGSCTGRGSGGGATGSPSGPGKTKGVVVTFDGDPVRGALVGVLVTGLPTKFSGQEASVTFHAWEDQASIATGLPRPVGSDGSVRLEFLVPDRIPRQGSCPAQPPCDFVEVGLRAGAYGVQITTQQDVLADADITPVPAKADIAYIADYVTECGPPRIHFDGAIWVPKAGTGLPAATPGGATRGTFTLVPGGTAQFASLAGDTVEMVTRDPATFSPPLAC